MLNNKLLFYLLLWIAAIAALSGIYNLIFNNTAILEELLALSGIIAGAVFITFTRKKGNAQSES